MKQHKLTEPDLPAIRYQKQKVREEVIQAAATPSAPAQASIPAASSPSAPAAPAPKSGGKKDNDW